MFVPYDNEKAQMIMGWNRAKQAGLIPDGAQVEVVRFNSSTTLSTYKSKIDWADTLIFNSEITRASRMNGGGWESSYILSVIDYAEDAGKTTVVQSVDKPYDVQSYPKADAVIAAYGCKGSSVDPTEALTGGAVGSQSAYGPNIIAGIEVILGVYGARGKLPVNIPQYKNGSYTSTMAFNRGHGLMYSALK
jgi:beta-N-acetylhexosaminidase